MREEEFDAAIEEIERGSEGSGYHLRVWLRNGTDVEGAWAPVRDGTRLAKRGLIRLWPTLETREEEPMIIAKRAVVAVQGNFAP